MFDRAAIPGMVAVLINEDPDDVEDGEFFAAVAVVNYRHKWLLGLAKNTEDDREGKWCFPGGGIKDESPEDAAVRECYEETGVRVKSVGKAFKRMDRPGVAFVHCRASSDDQPEPNHEFEAIGFFTKRAMRGLKLFSNVKSIISRCSN